MFLQKSLYPKANFQHNKNVFLHSDRYKLFIVLFDTVHPEDGRGRRPKHLGVVNKKTIISAFVGFSL